MIPTAIRLALAAAAMLPQTPAPNAGHTLMPVPATMVRQPGLLRLDSTFGVTGAAPSDGRLQRAIARAIARLERRTGIALGKRVADSGRAGLALEVHGP